MTLSPTQGLKTEQWWSMFFKQKDNQTSWMKDIARDINEVLKLENKFLYLNWPLSTAGIAESLSFSRRSVFG